MRHRFSAAVASVTSRPFLALGIVAWAFAAVALALRIPFGAGTTDEAFYAAMPYGFLLGNKPYQDELAFHQNAAILVMPLFRVYMWLFDSEGIIVFSRWLYAAYIGLCSYLAFRLARKLTSAATAAWVAALVLTFSYYNLFTLSYNTLGALGVLAGVLLSTEALLDRPALKLVAASFFFATAAFSYPTFSCIAVAHQALVLVRLRRCASQREFRRGLLAAVLSALAIVLLAAAFIAWVTPAGIARALEFSRAMGYGKRPFFGTPNFFDSEIWAQHNYLLAYGLLLAVLPVALKRVRRAKLLLALAVLAPVLLLLIYWRTENAFTITRGAIFLTICPVLAPMCMALAPHFRHRRLVLEQLWAPGVVSLGIVAVTSANGPIAAHLGALPALIAGMVSLSALVDGISTSDGGQDARVADAVQATPTARAAQWIFPSFAAALLATQVHTLFNGVYDFDVRLSTQTSFVHHGPYRGAFSTEANVKLLEAVDTDLKRIADPSKTLAAFDDFCVAYLSTRMRPRTFTHWVVWVFEPKYGARIVRETYGVPATQPDFVLLLPPRLKKRNQFLRYKSSYKTIIDRPELGYTIEQRIGTDTAPEAAASSPVSPAPARRTRRHR